MIRPRLTRINARRLLLVVALAVGAHACGGGKQVAPDGRATDTNGTQTDTNTTGGRSSCVLDQSALDDCAL